jgi:hypothetical protein
MRQTRNLFWGNSTGVRIPPSPFPEIEPAKRLSRDRIDAMQVHTLVNVDVNLPLLKE